MIKQKAFRFTLIEAIIIIVILAVLSALILPFIANKREQAKRKECENNLKKIGFAMVFYGGCNGTERYPFFDGRTGLQLLAETGFMENTQVYVCPSTDDFVADKSKIPTNSSYCYKGDIEETSPSPVLGKATTADRANNHNKYGNILFQNNQVKGYSGANWSSNFGGSVLVDFK